MQQSNSRKIKPMRGHSPQRSPTKFTSNLLNISNKFAGTGGSNLNKLY